MKHLLFLGLLFFSPRTKTLDNTIDEIEMDKRLRKLTMAQGFSLPDMQVKFDIFVSPDSILYEMPRLLIGGQEAKCCVCGDMPFSIEYSNDSLVCYCSKHYPVKEIKAMPAVVEKSVPPIPEPV